MSEHIPEQPEHVDGRPIAAALAGAVLAIVACAVIVWALVGRATGGEHRAALELQPSAQPFSQPLDGEAQRAAARASLDAWSWADRAHGTVRLPVNVAIDRYLEAPR